ncbi:MAG: 50S ribosomal protein L18e [Candidatus ainarchaeum sp.]|nr:50S ribosomal protein L18e [Candidatus ainarchaeum sp.]
MTKKLETQKLVAKLEIVSRKTKKKIWKDLAKRIQKPTRNNIVVNVEKLDKMAKKFKGKTIIVPGKILSKGEFEEKITIIGITASQKAIEKINKTGKFIHLKDFVNEKINTKEIILVK